MSSNEYKDLNPETPCLIGGDFNDWRSLLRALFIEGLDFNCATDKESKKGLPNAIKTYPSFAPTGGLDRIYYRGGLRLLSAKRCRYKVSKVASDHLAIITEFDLS